jgi:hypothetical protein
VKPEKIGDWEVFSIRRRSRLALRYAMASEMYATEITAAGSRNNGNTTLRIVVGMWST